MRGCARGRTHAAGDDFAIVFAGIGVPYDSAEFFRKSLEQSGALERTALFLNLASDSSTQRLLTPRFALTAAEYLAFVEGKHVLAILTDMTNYAEALREVSSSKGEIPSRKGFPGYMYSDLASLFERAGCIRGTKGTLTQLSILTMPADDIGHPIPDLTGYITEGQIVLSRDLDRRAVYPPIDVLPSLSRLMKDGTGGNYTHPDHPALSSQLYAAYARAVQARVLASVVGEEGLAATDRQYLDVRRRVRGQPRQPVGGALARTEHGGRLAASRRIAGVRIVAPVGRPDRRASGSANPEHPHVRHDDRVDPHCLRCRHERSEPDPRRRARIEGRAAGDARRLRLSRREMPAARRRDPARTRALRETRPRAFLAAHRVAIEALRAAIARHGLEGLQVYPALDHSRAAHLARAARRSWACACRTRRGDRRTQCHRRRCSRRPRPKPAGARSSG